MRGRLLFAALVLLILAPLAPAQDGAAPPGTGGVRILNSDGTLARRCLSLKLDDEVLSASSCSLVAGPTVLTGTGGCVSGATLCDPDGIVWPAGVAADARNAEPYFDAQGTTLPSTCTTGQSFFKTNEPFGLQNYRCTATDTWSRVTLETLHAYACGLTGLSADTQYAQITGNVSALRCHTAARMCWSNDDCSSENCDILQTNAQAVQALTYRTVYAASASLLAAHVASGTYTFTLNGVFAGDTSVAMTPTTSATVAKFTSATGVSLPAYDQMRWKITSTTDAATSPNCVLLTLYVSNRNL